MHSNRDASGADKNYVTDKKWKTGGRCRELANDIEPEQSATLGLRNRLTHEAGVRGVLEEIVDCARHAGDRHRLEPGSFGMRFFGEMKDDSVRNCVTFTLANATASF